MYNEKIYVQQAEAALLSNKQAVTAMKMFSVSDEDFAMKKAAYIRTMAFTAMMEDRVIANGAKRRVMFAANPGMAAANLRGTTIYPATILSYVSNIAPIFSVERNMDTPSMDLQFMDFYNIATGDEVVPNLGRDKAFGANIHTHDLTTAIRALDADTKRLEYNASAKLTPNTVVIKFFDGTHNYVIRDDGQGTLMAAPGLLSAGTVNYTTGAFSMTFVTVPSTSTSTMSLEVALDIPANDNVDKLGAQNKYYHLNTEPVVIPLQRNIITDAAMAKQGVLDPNKVYTNLIQSQYSKLINEKTVGSIVNNYDGNALTADLSSFGLASGRYDTLIRTFQSLLVDGESRLAAQTYKGAKVTGILAGAKISNMFQYMNENEGWIPNTKMGYFKDLLGWYKGVPVVRWSNNDGDSVRVGDNDLYLTHRTEDGQLAPVMRGMFLSPTDLPEIANFDNPVKHY